MFFPRGAVGEDVSAFFLSGIKRWSMKEVAIVFGKSLETLERFFSKENCDMSTSDPTFPCSPSVSWGLWDLLREKSPLVDKPLVISLYLQIPGSISVGPVGRTGRLGPVSKLWKIGFWKGFWAMIFSKLSWMLCVSNVLSWVLSNDFFQAQLDVVVCFIFLCYHEKLAVFRDEIIFNFSGKQLWHLGNHKWRTSLPVEYGDTGDSLREDLGKQCLHDLQRLFQNKWKDFRIIPWKINMEPKNHLFEKENHLPNLHYYVPC